MNERDRVWKEVLSLILKQASMESRERVMREKRVYEACLSGNVESLNQLVKEDKLILARLSLTCFNETPLHVATMLGHVEFVKALLSHKRDLITELDSQGRSPLHLASANGYIEIVKVLLLVDSSVCLVRDEDGRTPLHLAAMKGRVDIVNELAQVHQEVIQYTFDSGETILHLCVIHNRLEALKRLVELCIVDDFVNVKDDHGNTLLHTATALKQMETIKYLVSRTGVRVNAVNGNGFTALDMIDHTPKDLKAMEIRELLVEAGTQRARAIPASAREYPQMTSSDGERNETPPPPPPPPPSSTRPPSSRKLIKKQDSTNWVEKMRDPLMVAATVIAAMAYQAGLNPPGGVWQESVYINKTTGESQKAYPAVTSAMDYTYHQAGTSIMAYTNNTGFKRFWLSNTASFVASLSIIFLLISGLPLRKKFLMWLLMAAMWVTITCMAITYCFSIVAISPNHEWESISIITGMSVLVWLVLIAIVFIVHTCLIIKRIVKKCKRALRRNEAAGQNESNNV